MKRRILLLTIILLFSLSACEFAKSLIQSSPVATEPAAIHTDTPEPTLTSTQTPTPTVMPSPTAVPPTLTPTMTDFERAALRLYKASLNYIADTPQEALEVVKGIGFLDGTYENPSNACGPLTVAIMRDGGFLPEDTPVKNMWLLCPRKEEMPECDGMRTLNRVYFPPEDYDYIRIRENVKNYDFVENPLRVGDWLYLFVLKGVSAYEGFDHMIVVTRVDENGAAYSVTNIDHGEGFIIQEELLYDPTRPGIGLFYELSNDELRKELGMTGTAGFLLVRLKEQP